MKETEIAIIGIVVKDLESVPELNSILSAYGDFILGRMGVPHIKKKVNIISIVIDAEKETIDSLEDRIGKLEGVFIL